MRHSTVRGETLGVGSSLAANLIAGSLLAATVALGSCGGAGKSEAPAASSPDASCPDAKNDGRSAPTYRLGGQVEGLLEGVMVLRNGLDTVEVAADESTVPGGQSKKFCFERGLPADTPVNIQITTDMLGKHALQCVVAAQILTMPARNSDDEIIIKCERVRSVRLLAGDGPAPSGRDGPAETATFDLPLDLAADEEKDGKVDIFVVDNGNRSVRKVTRDLATNRSTVVTLTQPGAIVGDVRAIALRGDYVYFVEGHGIKRVKKQGGEPPVQVAGKTFEAGKIDSQLFNTPYGLAFDVDGSLLVADYYNHALRRVTGWEDRNTRVTLVAGTGGETTEGDKPSVARLARPIAVGVCGTTGELFVLEYWNHVVRRLKCGSNAIDGNRSCSDGSVDVFAGAVRSRTHADNDDRTLARFNRPSGLAVDEGTADGCDIWITDRFNNAIRRISRGGTGIVKTLFGSPSNAGAADGVGADASFYRPRRVAKSGNSLYVVEENTNGLRQLSIGDLSVKTMIGGCRGDSTFCRLTGLAVDEARKRLVVADQLRHSIFTIDSSGAVQLLAGGSGEPGSADGVGAAARFKSPSGVAVDPICGDVYVADRENHAVRRVTPAGRVSVVYGQPGTAGGSLTGLSFPEGLTLTREGDHVSLWVADTANDAVRLIEADVPVATCVPTHLFSGTDWFRDAAFEPFGVAVTKERVYFIDWATSEINFGPRNSSPVAAEALSRFQVPSPFSLPGGLVEMGDGRLLIADTENASLREVFIGDAGIWQAKTLAGSEGTSKIVLGPLPAAIGRPRSVALDSRRIYFTSAGSLYFIDR